MRSINDAVKHLERVKEMVDHVHMEMCLGGASEPYESYKDEANAAYYGLIPKEERNKLTAEMRERLKAALTLRINELKAEFEKI